MAEGGGVTLETLQVILEVGKSQFEKSFEEAGKEAEDFCEKVALGVDAMVAAVVASLGTIGIISVREFAKFDDAMVKVTSTMEGMTSTIRQQMDDTALSVAENGRKSALELAGAYGDLKTAGLDAAQSMGALSTVEQFASTNQMTLADSTRYLVGAANNLKLTTEDVSQNTKNLAELSDLLTKASEVGKGTTTQYAEALAGASKNMEKFGISAKEGLIIFEALADKGIKGADAADTVNGAYRSLQTTVLKSKDVWDRYGLSIYDAGGKMRPLTAIVEDLDKATAGLSDEDKRAALSLLGFNNRTAEQIKGLMGTSGAIEKYTEKMNEAKGATAEAAEKQEMSFNAAMEKAEKMVKSAALSIGQQLLPSIYALVKQVQESDTAFNAWHYGIQLIADLLKFGLQTAIVGTMDLLYHLQMGIKAGSVVFEAFWLVVSGGANLALTAFSSSINQMVNNLNTLIELYDKIAPTLHLATIPAIASFRGLDEATQATKEAMKSASGAMNDTVDSIAEMVKQGKPSVQYLKDLEDQEEKARIEADKLAHTHLEAAKAAKAHADGLKGLSGGLKEIPSNLEAVNEATKKFELEKYLKDTETSFNKAMVKVGEWEKYVQHGSISNHQFADSLRKIMSANNEFISPVKGTEEKTGDASQDAAIDLRNQEKVLTDHYKQEESELQKHLAAMNQQDTKALAAETELMVEAKTRYAARLTALHEQERQLEVTAAQSIFDSLSSVMLTAFGKQSAMYKASFAATKAFAIAESMVHISAAMAKALDAPWPASLVAMATVASETASIISNISAVALSFEGGGDTGSGPRTGGVDGRGGFMAVMHPNEKVIDLNKESGEMSQPRDRTNMTINVPQTFTGGVTEKDLANKALLIKRETLGGMIDGIRRAGSFRKGVHR